jgi:molecular chaperone IbpA
MTSDPFSFTKSLFPSTVGFDRVFDHLENVHRSVAKVIPSYPPYNIKKVEDNKYVIELAVAGFGKQDLEIELKEGVLAIKGSAANSEDETFLYKGIADRAFTRQFTLADTIEIKNAELINGMLKVWLENIIPDEKKPKKIDIKDTSSYPTSKELLTEEDRIR